jgi:UDP-N-acetylmuramyl pentapeptide phosphotransferase/UDP-N-acetylglucosamine-1-phosphate transferase
VIYHLVEAFQGPLESTGLFTVLQVFFQVEFRAFLAVLVSFGLVLAFGRPVIHWLLRQKVGDSPEFHNADLNELMRSRAGTPTMGG